MVIGIPASTAFRSGAFVDAMYFHKAPSTQIRLDDHFRSFCTGHLSIYLTFEQSMVRFAIGALLNRAAEIYPFVSIGGWMYGTWGDSRVATFLLGWSEAIAPLFGGLKRRVLDLFQCRLSADVVCMRTIPFPG